MFGDKAEQEINKFPLSNNAIQRWNTDLSAKIEENVWNKLQNSEFALQVDESTDITNTAVAVVVEYLTILEEKLNYYFS